MGLFLKNAPDLDMIPKQYEGKEEFIKAFKVASQVQWTKKELEVYDYMGLQEADIVNELEKAEMKAEKRGKVEGKIEFAINLLDILDNQTISDKSGLTIEEVIQLRKNNKLESLFHKL